MSFHQRADQVDLPEVCYIVDASAATVYRWRRRGDFPPGQRIPAPAGRLYFSRAAVEEFAAKRRGEVQ